MLQYGNVPPTAALKKQKSIYERTAACQRGKKPGKLCNMLTASRRKQRSGESE